MKVEIMNWIHKRIDQIESQIGNPEILDQLRVETKLEAYREMLSAYESGAFPKEKIEGIGAAKVISKFLWQRKKQLKPNLTRENKIEIQQDSIMELLMEFQEWQIDELNSES